MLGLLSRCICHCSLTRLLVFLTMAVAVVDSAAAVGWGRDAKNREASVVQPRNLAVAGYVEYVRIYPENIRLEARMDTGATTSSLNALHPERFRRDGRSWIRFDIFDPDDGERLLTLEREVIRTVRVIRHDGNHQSRPVVRMGFCIGSTYREGEVTLIDRSELTYQLLVGRNHMKDVVLVDSGLTHILKPDCPGR